VHSKIQREGKREKDLRHNVNHAIQPEGKRKREALFSPIFRKEGLKKIRETAGLTTA